MKIFHLLPVPVLLIGAALLFTGCSFLRHSETLESPDSPVNELVPQTEVTLESKIKSAKDMCAFLKSSYEKMQKLASLDNAPSDGIKAAKSVEEQYSGRLKELFALDFSAMDEETIDSCLVEMTNLITAVREAKDALTLG